VLLRKPRSPVEIYNDLDDDIVNVFRTLRDPRSLAQLIRWLKATPYARAEFRLAWKPARSRVERARRTLVRAMMGFGSAGATKGSTGWRVDTQAGASARHAHWSRYPVTLRAVAERFTGVIIEQRPALEVMTLHDGPDTLHLVDPPYLFGTRQMSSKCYRHELDDQGHVELLTALGRMEGMVVLCGYPNELYTRRLRGWQEHRTQALAAGLHGAVKRTEAAWLNPACVRALGQFGPAFPAAHL
jgi:DNA adenine methylase